MEKEASIELIIPMGSVLTLAEMIDSSTTIESVSATPEVTDTDSNLNVLSFTASEDVEIEWNNRLLPAPTGVRMTFEPYVLILAAGLMIGMLFWLGRRKKRNRAGQ